MKTEREKLKICINYLESRGYKVCRPLMTRSEVADLLGISLATFSRIVSPANKESRSDFPKSFNVGNMNHGSPRWKAEMVMKWIDERAGEA